MYKILKKMIPLRAKGLVNSMLFRKHIELTEGRKIFVFLVADYGNIGDIAISFAQCDYLARELGDYTVIRVPISKTRILIHSIKKQINSSDLVTIVGGGNMGSMYPDIEDLRQLVIRSFSRNRIICFPQTLDWNATAVSSRSLQRIVKFYSRHLDIHVFARESITYSKLNELFINHPNVNIGLVPDIVMSTTAESLGARDCSHCSDILLCLRDDRESVLSAAQYDKLNNMLTSFGCTAEKVDTHAGGSQLDEAYCAQLLADKLGQFRSAQLVVTDRLHGMILCLLAGTPCLVLPNANHKIRQTWLDWLTAHPRLAFVEPDQFDEIPALIDKLLSGPHGDINEFPVVSSHYSSLKEALTRS